MTGKWLKTDKLWTEIRFIISEPSLYYHFLIATWTKLFLCAHQGDNSFEVVNGVLNAEQEYGTGASGWCARLAPG